MAEFFVYERPLNTYIPDSWVEKVERDLEYALHTREFSSKHACYLEGIAELDRIAYGWLATLAFHNGLGYPIRDVPEWVYTHQKKPRQ